MLESYDERRPRTNAFLRFQVGMEGVMTGLDDLSGNNWFEAEIRERHGYQAFQRRLENRPCSTALFFM